MDSCRRNVAGYWLFDRPLYPIAPDYNFATLANRKMPSGGQKQNEPAGAPDITQVRNAMASWRQTLLDAADNRREAMIAVDETLFYGTVLTTLASVQMGIVTSGKEAVSAGLRHSRNIGAGAALGANLVGGRYQLPEQEKIFRSFASRMHCGVNALRGIDMDVWKSVQTTHSGWIEEVDTAIGEGKPGLAAQVVAAPGVAYDFLDLVEVPALREALATVTLKSLSSTEILAFAKAINESNAQATAAVKAATTPPGTKGQGSKNGDAQTVNNDDLALKTQFAVLTKAVLELPNSLLSCSSLAK